MRFRYQDQWQILSKNHAHFILFLSNQAGDLEMFIANHMLKLMNLHGNIGVERFLKKLAMCLYEKIQQWIIFSAEELLNDFIQNYDLRLMKTDAIIKIISGVISNHYFERNFKNLAFK